MLGIKETMASQNPEQKVAIVTGIHAGISIETLAMNARTSTDMIDRFYGSHVLSALNKGTEIVDSVRPVRSYHFRKIGSRIDNHQLSRNNRAEHNLCYTVEPKKLLLRIIETCQEGIVTH